MRSSSPSINSMTMMATSSNHNKFPFDVVVVTSPDPEAAPVDSLREHLDSSVKLISTSDPFGARCGSGGGTLAALECSGATKESTVLIIHAGGESSRCPTQMVMGKAWTSLPRTSKNGNVSISNPTVQLLQVLSSVFRNIPKGSIVVAASDCILELPMDNEEEEDWFERYNNCVVGVAVPALLNTAKNHGVFVLNKGAVTGFLQKPSPATMKEMECCVFNGNQAWIDTGVVAFFGSSATALWNLASTLDACTESGLRRLYQDEPLPESITLEEFARQRALRVELYTHIMMASSFQTFEAYKQACGSDGLPLQVLQNLYSTLSSFPLQAITIPQGTFTHLGTSRELLEFYFGQSQTVKRAHAFLPYSPQTCVAINVVIEATDTCVVGESSVVEHSHIFAKHVDVGSKCLLSGVRGSCESLIIPSSMIFQMIPLSSNDDAFVYMYLGLDDGIKSGETMWGVPIKEILSKTGLDQLDIWSDKNDKTVWKARIHPIFQSRTNDCVYDDLFYWIYELRQNENKTLSPRAMASMEIWKSLSRLPLCKIRQRANAVAEISYRENLQMNVLPSTVSNHCRAVGSVLRRRQHVECNIEPIVGNFAATGHWSKEVKTFVNMLGEVFLESFDRGDYDIAGRASMILGDLLLRLAASKSEPIRASFDSDSQVNRVKELRTTEQSFQMVMSNLSDSFSRSDVSHNTLVTCAAAMERYSSEMTQYCIVTNSNSPSLLPRISTTPLDTWVIAAAPARIDLAGGWSDTPPICVEHGGAVCNIAVTVDGCKPLSCRSRMISGGNGILLRSEGRDLKTGELTSEITVLLVKIGDLAGYTDPMSDCSLLKCALVYFGLVSPEMINESPDEGLSICLEKFCYHKNAGLEIVTTSLLPHGSGMGTSSILGGCIIASLSTCLGLDMSNGNLIHMVLMLEQVLCTGGGWQDQTGGLIGGAKLCMSKQAIPIEIDIEHIVLDPTFEDKLNQRLMLVFTGQTRLAKNILQTVLRHWGRRRKDVVNAVEQLVAGALKARNCLANQDLDGLADCLNAYWKQKKVMAGDTSEPPVVCKVLTELLARGYVQAGSLCGAGGGGFMVLLLRTDIKPQMIQDFCRDEYNDETATFTWHDCQLSGQGITTTILRENQADDSFDIRWHQAVN